MPLMRQRRSCRIATAIPICIYGIDFRGIDFTEEASTLVVNLHGAKIRLTHQLLPDQEIRLLSHPTSLEALFRVVTRVPESYPQGTFWGIEALNPERNIWGMNIPEILPPDQGAVRVFAQCPECSTRELLRMEEPFLVTAQEAGGIYRGCLVCGKQGLWKFIPYGEEEAPAPPAAEKLAPS